YLTLFARTQNFDKSLLESELYWNRHLGKIRCMRKTLFIHTKEMLPIAYAATKKIIEQYFDKFFEIYEISEEEYETYSEKISFILNENELSTSEIKKRLDGYKKTTQLLGLMCDQGILIRGTPVKGWKDRRNNYTLFRNYFPDMNLKKYDETDALNILLKKYLITYGPSTENDISWWCGIGKLKVRDTLDKVKDEIEIVKIERIKHEYLIFRSDIEKIDKNSPFKENSVIFLPMLDPYIMGYKDRERYIDYKHNAYVFDRSGNATSTIMHNGTIIGIWDNTEKPEPMIKVFLFEEINEEVKNLIKIKANELGKFIHEKDVNVKECKKMEPLTKRTAGNFMTPLKNC
ncbi:MAG: DNA glycosylase AlkZ-like family protein, partial [Promethearchaeota archaeon]